ncbi:DUF2963 domain-containing protein [Candidatus Phytoplasma tritici]|uniref:DUF2963 domain-containing protein n=1 Tax=Candidatus Phytoplasma tritici TaxID=321961 RepID=UPI0003F774E1|nr:DUF2963 domain-containing protein [Candidatus Phytoplasma tritici]
MQTNNQKKLKNKIFIIWGLFISGVIFVITILFLLILKPTISNLKKQEPLSNVKTKTQQEQENYNRIINKIEKEVDELTQQPEQTSSLKYPPKTTYYGDGKKIKCIDEYNQESGKLIKAIEYYENGNILLVEEYQKGFLSKATYFNLDGTIKEIINY